MAIFTYKGAEAMLLDGNAPDESGAGGGMNLAEDHPEDGALASAVVAEKAKNLAFGNIEGKLVDGGP